MVERLHEKNVPETRKANNHIKAAAQRAASSSYQSHMKHFRRLAEMITSAPSLPVKYHQVRERSMKKNLTSKSFKHEPKRNVHRL
jgi:hypothetical protein